MSFSGSLIIVNFNSGGSLARCLDSIKDHASDASVLVIDNASTDGSELAAERWGSPVVLQKNGQNVGFARAVNQGLARTNGEFVAFLNPDCELRSNVFDVLAAQLASHPECAIAGPRILDDDGGIQGSARGDPTMLTGLFGRTTLLTRLFSGSQLAQRNVRADLVTESGEVDWVSGACMLARREALSTVDGFDERYFLYWEDADICRRLRNRGYTVRYVPHGTVTHRVGQSSQTARSLATRAFHESAYTYYATHVAKTAFMRRVAWLILEARCRLKLRAVS
jgi:GT2 family glycosyltransferase